MMCHNTTQGQLSDLLPTDSQHRDHLSEHLTCLEHKRYCLAATIRVPRKGNGERCFRSELPLSVPSCRSLPSCHQLLDAGRTQTPPLCLVSASKPVWKACVRTSVLPSRGNRDHILHGWLWACSHAECLSMSNESGAAQN